MLFLTKKNTTFSSVKLSTPRVLTPEAPPLEGLTVWNTLSPVFTDVVNTLANLDIGVGLSSASRKKFKA